MYHVLSHVLFSSYPSKKDQDYEKDLEEQGVATV